MAKRAAVESAEDRLIAAARPRRAVCYRPPVQRRTVMLASVLASVGVGGIWWGLSGSEEEALPIPVAIESPTILGQFAPPPFPSSDVTSRRGNEPVSSVPNGKGILSISELGISAVIADSLKLEGKGWTPPAGGVGWFSHSAPLIADRGTTTLAGHSYFGGPDIFASLKKIQPGNIVWVSTASARQSFIVNALFVYKQDELPRWVFGSREGPRRLLLVTCGGEIVVDRTGQHFSKNLVVEATQFESREYSNG